MLWKVITQVLKGYHFNLVLLDWINIMYTDVSMCVYNNGKTGQYFNLQQGVRQGESLSLYLYIHYGCRYFNI